MNWFDMIMKLLPVIKQALDAIMSRETHAAGATGNFPSQAAVQRFIDHNTPGKPNATELGPDAKTHR